jgi:hypothetical protein
MICTLTPQEKPLPEALQLDHPYWYQQRGGCCLDFSRQLVEAIALALRGHGQEPTPNAVLAAIVNQAATLAAPVGSPVEVIDLLLRVQSMDRVLFGKLSCNAVSALNHIISIGPLPDSLS